jgi:hypothetical protein
MLRAPLASEANPPLEAGNNPHISVKARNNQVHSLLEGKRQK